MGDMSRSAKWLTSVPKEDTTTPSSVQICLIFHCTATGSSAQEDGGDTLAY